MEKFPWNSMEIDVLILHGIPWRIFHGNPWNSMEVFHTGCGAVVKELLAPADKPGSTPGDAASVSLYRFFFLPFGLFFNTVFPFGLFFFILTADPAGQALGSILIF